jgi:hypothetical protein
VWVLSCSFVTREGEGREVICYGCKGSVVGVGRGGGGGAAAAAAAVAAVAMEIFYYVVFALQILVLVALEFSKSRKDRITTSPAFNAFKNNYILVFSLMMAGDWLQGPYVYALYSFYGYDKGDIGRLFIAGFGSSMLFGTIVGSFADR